MFVFVLVVSMCNICVSLLVSIVALLQRWCLFIIILTYVLEAFCLVCVEVLFETEKSKDLDIHRIVLNLFFRIHPHPREPFHGFCAFVYNLLMSMFVR